MQMHQFLGAVALAAVFSNTAHAHGGPDHVQELAQSYARLDNRQSEFEKMQRRDEKMENLKSQIEALENRILVLRNLMASEYPHVKAAMGKYKVDYLESVNDSLVQMRTTLGQLEQMLSDK